jgi:hypothetical protein
MDPVILPFCGTTTSGPQPAVIVTSYSTGAPNGKNLGRPGYSYDFVARLFAPLIEQWGELFVVPRDEVDHAVEQARTQGFQPIHLSFLPLQDVRLAKDAPNVVVPAWEYPDVPDHEFDYNPQNDWVKMAAQCDVLVVGGPFTRDAFRRAAVQTPIRIVQVPTPDDYFQTPFWNPNRQASLNFSGHTFSCPDGSLGIVEHQSWRLAPRDADQPCRLRQSISAAGRALYRSTIGRILSERLHYALKAAAYGGLCAWRDSRLFRLPTFARPAQKLLNLSGVVYTSIFNPKDHRKNWEDLLTGFLCALKDCGDATLVLKLITSQPGAVDEVWNFYRRTGIPHHCKVAFVRDFLTDQQLLELVGASTYYITTTRAEGNCLPLMNYLAAGRPGISPCHTAIADYFGRSVGFVVDSHPEPAAFPQDYRLRKTTSWHRLVWPSLAEQIRKSYEVAKNDSATYQQLARNAREKMLRWSSVQAVAPRLHDALQSASQTTNEQAETADTRLRVLAA